MSDKHTSFIDRIQLAYILLSLIMPTSHYMIGVHIKLAQPTCGFSGMLVPYLLKHISTKLLITGTAVSTFIAYNRLFCDFQ